MFKISVLCVMFLIGFKNIVDNNVFEAGQKTQILKNVMCMCRVLEAKHMYVLASPRGLCDCCWLPA